jgi:hypothetical protein
MKENLRRLNWILKLIPEDNFYSISLTSSEVSLQGFFNTKIVLFATKFKFEQSVNPHGYICFKRRNYEICLT